MRLRSILPPSDPRPNCHPLNIRLETTAMVSAVMVADPSGAWRGMTPHERDQIARRLRFADHLRAAGAIGEWGNDDGR